MKVWKRWGIFNLVGFIGFAVQLAVVFLMRRFLSVSYLLATFVGVETAVLHNFLWHEHFTWADIVSRFRHAVVRRLIRFHLANGMISIGGNMVFTWILVERFHFPYLLANAVAVLICSLVNFIAADRLVFGMA